MSHVESNHWVEPAQKRSKDKVARILDAARALIVETGSANLKMTEVAKRAGVAVGTLYQFFPASSGLVEKLFAIEMQRVDDEFEAMLHHSQSWSDLLNGIEGLLLQQFEIVKTEPALLILLGASGLNADLQSADFENTKKNAAALTRKMMQLSDTPIDQNTAEALSMLICHLWSSVVRLSLLDQDHEPEVYLAHFKGMIKSYANQV
ncbi:MAG: TetR/AcrR family transcriptional regulator [Litoreibacter sp.]|nr:TetR/AcrR family transcriptional regulator [Litoreibacter sp.]